MDDLLYLLKMVNFHGYVSLYQRIILSMKTIRILGMAIFTFWHDLSLLTKNAVFVVVVYPVLGV